MPLSAKKIKAQRQRDMEFIQATFYLRHEYDPAGKRGEGQLPSLHLSLSAPHQQRWLLSGCFSEHGMICSAETLKAGF